MSDPAWTHYLAKVRAAFNPPPPALLPYLDTFERDSDANRAARIAAWERLPTDVQEALREIMREAEPQLFT